MRHDDAEAGELTDQSGAGGGALSPEDRVVADWWARPEAPRRGREATHQAASVAADIGAKSPAEPEYRPGHEDGAGGELEAAHPGDGRGECAGVDTADEPREQADGVAGENPRVDRDEEGRADGCRFARESGSLPRATERSAKR